MSSSSGPPIGTSSVLLEVLSLALWVENYIARIDSGNFENSPHHLHLCNHAQSSPSFIKITNMHIISDNHLRILRGYTNSERIRR